MTIADDPTTASRLRPLRLLLEQMNDDIARLYTDRGVVGVRPRFSMALIRLHHRGPMTIRALAHEVDVSHSAMSQTITVMRREGLVAAGTGPDARTRLISLTAYGREVVPLLEAEWRATEAALAELDEQIPYPLQQVVADLSEALDQRSFYDRILEHLDSPADPA